ELPDGKHHAVLHEPLLCGPRVAVVSTAVSNSRAAGGGEGIIKRWIASPDLRAFLDQELLQQGPVALVLVLAVAAHREALVGRQRGQHREEPLRLRIPHLLPVSPLVRGPARPIERSRERPRHEWRARRELGEPDVVVVTPGVVLLADAAWRTAHGADAKAF